MDSKASKAPREKEKKKAESPPQSTTTTTAPTIDQLLSIPKPRVRPCRVLMIRDINDQYFMERAAFAPSLKMDSSKGYAWVLEGSREDKSWSHRMTTREGSKADLIRNNAWLVVVGYSAVGAAQLLRFCAC